MIKVEVTKVVGWERAMQAALDTEYKKAVHDTSLEMAKVAVDIARTRQRIGHHRKMMEITSLTVFEYSRGFEGGIVSPAFYAWFQSTGTLASRKKRLKKATIRRRESPSGKARYAKVAGNKGISPLLFFEKATTVGRKELKKRIEEIT